MCFDDGRLAIDRQPGNFKRWFIDCIDFVARKWRTLIARVNLLVPVPFDTVSPGGDRRVEPAVARWLPHRPGRADFPHPVLPVEDSPENSGLRRPSPPVLATRCCSVDASRCSVSSWRFPSTVLPFSGCLPWLLRGSLRSRFATFQFATTKALRLLPSLRVRLLWRLASAYCRCIAWLRSHCGSMLPLRAWTLVIRCRPFPGFGFGRKQEFSQVHRAPFSCTFATVSDPGRTGGDWPFSSPPARSPLGLRRRLPHWSFRGSIPRLWCSLSTLRASLAADYA